MHNYVPCYISLKILNQSILMYDELIKTLNLLLVPKYEHCNRIYTACHNDLPKFAAVEIC